MKQTVSFPRKAFALIQKLLPQKRRRRIMRGLDIFFLGMLVLIIGFLLLTALFAHNHAKNQVGKHGGYIAAAAHTTSSSQALRQDKQQRVAKDQNPLSFLADHMNDEGLIVQNPIFMKVWQAALVVNDALLVIMFLIAGYSVMAGAAGFRYADAVETLPRIFLAALAAHASLVICTTFVGLENVITSQIYHAVGSITFNTATANSLGNQIGQVIGQGLAGITNFINKEVNPIYALLLLIMTFAIWFLQLTIFVQLIMRIFMLSTLGAISPLGLGAWGLPLGAGQQLTRMWFTSFITTVMVQFIQIVAYVISQGFLNWFLNVYLVQHTDGLLQNIGVSFLTQQDVLNGALEIGVLWFIIRIPGLMQSAAVGIVSDSAQSASGSVQSVVTTTVQTVAAVAQTAAGVATSFM